MCVQQVADVHAIEVSQDKSTHRTRIKLTPIDTLVHMLHFSLNFM